MLQSMTGFGAAAGAVDRVEYAVEVRSVNHRYLKTSLRLPEAFTAAEPDIDKLIRDRISRGSVQLTVRMRLPEEAAAWKVNAAALAAYIDQLRLLEVEANPTLRIDLATLLTLPGVCDPPSSDQLRETTQGGLITLIGQALEQLTQMRQREGAALRDELLAQCDVITRQVKQISARGPQVVKDYQQRLTQRIADLLGQSGPTLDSDALAREVAVFAERCDIAEEVHRLNQHVDEFRRSCDSRDPAGRKLDFIAQEMLREANTMGSKSNDAEITRCVVEIKTAVDRIKEQVQNAE